MLLLFFVFFLLLLFYFALRDDCPLWFVIYKAHGALWDPYFCRNPVPATPAAVYSRNNGIYSKAFPDLGSVCHL